MEGHAEYITKQFCEAEGEQDLWRRIREPMTSRPTDMSPYVWADLYFEYVEARCFFEYMARKRPPALFGDIVTNRLPTEREIVHPDEYLSSKGAKDRTTILVNPALIDKGRGEPQQAVIGYSAFRSYVLQATENDVKRRTLIDAFEGGSRLSTATQQITVMAFDKEDAAALCYAVVRDEYVNRTRHSVAEKRRGSIRAASCALPIKGQQEASVTVLLIDGKKVVEVNWFVKGKREAVDPDPISDRFLLKYESLSGEQR